MSTKVDLAYGNVLGGGTFGRGDRDKEHNWTKRITVVAALIRKMSPDAFSMVESHHQNDSDKRLEKAVGAPYVLARGGEGAGCLYDSTTLRLMASASWTLPDTSYKSISFWRFQVVDTGAQFVYSSLHLSANLGDDMSGLRRKQMKFCIEKATWAKGYPLVWAGDFNETGLGKSDAKGYLAAEGYKTLQVLSPKAGYAEYSSLNGKKNGKWIDDIAVKSPVTVSNVRLVKTGRQEVADTKQMGASDHWGWPQALVDLHDVVKDEPPVVAVPVPPAVTPTPEPLPAVAEPTPVVHRGPGSRPPEVTPVRGGTGRFRTFARHPGGRVLEISTFRGVPTTLSQWSTADPFGDATASLSLPQVSSFERPGEGDLWWLVPWFGIEVRYEEYTDDRWVDTGWRWEGNAVSEEIGDDHSLSLKGALYMTDNFQAAPSYPQYPVPYERLIASMLDPVAHPSLPNKALKVEFPEGWNVTVPAFDEPAYLWFLRPFGVKKGDLWSGLTTRSTGSWEPGLTGFVQTLLSTMYTPEGDQWTVMMKPGRQPVLKVRGSQRAPDLSTLVVYNGTPGVKVQVSRDFTQSANVIYGAGTDLAGSTFSGAQVTPDGESTFYEPFAALPQVYPAASSNPRLVKTMARKESRITFPQGIDENTARDISRTQIRRFADPGYAGSITLDADPFLGGEPFNRLLIQAGGTILVRNLRGGEVLFHVSQADVSPQSGTVSLTVDTKFRDLLTVAEVRARTRDALDPVNLLQVGKQSVTVQDLLKPWSYSGGSGVIPSGSALDATPLFAKMDTNATFPWTGWTTQYPPSKFPQYYVKVSKKGPKAADRWQDNGYSATSKKSKGVPVKAAQSGSIRLTQIAAYDKDGHQSPVKFHVGIYSNSGITSTDMPMIPKGAGLKYADGDRYPFLPEAFEAVKPTGEEQDNVNVLLPEGADIVVGWGSVHDPAGYSPGLASAGGIKTGRLVDESSWSFDTSNVPGFDKYSVANNAKNQTAGMLYLMLFCDDTDEDTFFLGRLFSQPYGAS